MLFDVLRQRFERRAPHGGFAPESRRLAGRNRRRRLWFDRLEMRDLLSANPVSATGGEFLVNTTTPGVQTTDGLGLCPRSVAMDGAGNAVVVWASQTASGGYDVEFQRYDASGAPLGGETIAAASNTSAAMVARAATSGSFVVAWNVRAADGSLSAHARLFGPDGAPLSGDLNVGGNGYAFAQSVAMDAGGDFAVVYGALTSRGGSTTKTWKVQRYDASATPAGKPISTASPSLVNGQAAISMDAAGDFVVTWDDANSNGQFIYAQRYSSSGKAVGRAIQVNQDSSGPSQWQSNSGMDASGDFVVVWEQKTATGGDVLWTRGFLADGTPRGPQVVAATGVAEEPPAVAVRPDGSFALAWSTPVAVTAQPDHDVYAGTFDAQGNSLQTAFRVNTTQAGLQDHASAAVDSTGNLMIVWSGNGVGDDSGVFGQRYQPVLAASLLLSPAISTSSSPSGSMIASPSSADSPLAPLSSGIAATDAVLKDW